MLLFRFGECLPLPTSGVQCFAFDSLCGPFFRRLPSPLCPILDGHLFSSSFTQLVACGILDFCVCVRQSPEYLLRWINGNPLDNTWVPLHDISLDPDPYLLAFHQRYPVFPVPCLLHQSCSKLEYCAAMAS